MALIYNEKTGEFNGENSEGHDSNTNKKPLKFFFKGGLHREQVAYCSDKRCPCPELPIPHGQGYFYVEKVGDYYDANLVCEQGAKLRGLDLEVAHQDAVRWWQTGMVPMRETPKSKVPHDVSRETVIPDWMKKAHQERLAQIQSILDVLEKSNTDEYFFFDTETTGVPRDYNAPASNIYNWPHAVQISWITTDANRSEHRSENHIIKPIGFTIPSSATAIHGITQDIAMRYGKEIGDILDIFEQHITKAKYIVGHNIDFDIKIIQAECCRLGRKDPFNGKQILDTMKSSVNFCKIPSKSGYYGGYKWPSLIELHTKLFGTVFNNAHNSMSDVRATLKCFWALRDKNIL